MISADDLTNVESIHREMVLVRLNLTRPIRRRSKGHWRPTNGKCSCPATRSSRSKLPETRRRLILLLARLEPLGVTTDITRTGLVALKLTINNNDL